jgi:hypothetical protein
VSHARGRCTTADERTLENDNTTSRARQLARDCSAGDATTDDNDVGLHWH